MRGRLRAVVSCAGGVLAIACFTRCNRDGGAGTPDPLQLLREDRRVAELLVPCARNSFYDRDLSDPAAYLIEKLERGRPEPLKRSKEELGELGSRAALPLLRFFERNYADAMRSPYVENAVDAAAFSLTDEAHELLLMALRHPQESVRTKAVDGLERHGRPGDFELLREQLSAHETLELRLSIVGALFAMDPGRAEDQFLEWIAAGEMRELWAQAGPHFPLSRRDEAARGCAGLFERVELPLAVQLSACAARTGDGPALEHLRGELAADDAQRRLAAVHAASSAGLAGELERTLLSEPSEQLRTMAVSGIAEAGELTDERRTWLRTALDDGSLQVRSEALLVLCERGDPEALVRALAYLGAEAANLQAALQALRDPVRRDPDLARRAFERLLERHALEEHRPVQQRTSTFKGIGLVPLREAAAFLRGIAVAAEGEEIESLRAHEWLMIQASNTGVAGRGFLREELQQESDPSRRVDLIDALGSERDELAREALLELVEGQARNPLERLFAASRLAKVGPSWEVAPRLKRVSYEMQAPEELEARVALQCLLWYWY